MNIYLRYRFLVFMLLPVLVLSQSKLKIDNKRVVVGETLNYKASWGLFTIGTASTKIDKNLYRVGSTVCFKIDVAGQTNGLAKLFYVRDRWISYLDTATITSYKSFRSIREGTYELDEQIHFDHKRKKPK